MFFWLILSLLVKAQAPIEPVYIEISTNAGNMIARLYFQTPQHQSHFVNLINKGYYDSLLFHRVIKGFILQGGDPNSKYATLYDSLGNGGLNDMIIPAEISPFLIHKRGAISFAHTDNSAFATNSAQFFIVDGQPITANQITEVEKKIQKETNSQFRYTNIEKEIYERIGGVPVLDQRYTVAGEIISNLDVIDRIAKVAVSQDGKYRPVKDIRMHIRVLPHFKDIDF